MFFLDISMLVDLLLQYKKKYSHLPVCFQELQPLCWRPEPDPDRSRDPQLGEPSRLLLQLRAIPPAMPAMIW